VPTVSIITTVYDRPECLRHCIRTVKRLAFRDYEHIIAADCPPPATLDAVAQVVAEEGDDQVQLITLHRRFNNWGIAPAAAALGRATGRFVCFLSDDNGYLPDHLNQLVAELERDRGLGFVYSSCLYAGLTTLRHPTPRPARIDLGQPLFRRELFGRYLGNGLPFKMMAWDWYMIDALLKCGVRWKHIDQATFIFRLLAYPKLMVQR
jgi:glycosyltransferase involved in cell wall biosynthesis